MSNNKSNYERFANTNSYLSLLNNHRLDEPGLWQVFGEDPNCYYGGCHSRPSLGFVEGNLKDVIMYAVELPNFWQWGAGGDIEKIGNVKIVDGNTANRRKRLNEHRAYLQEEIKVIDAELENL